ncbi:MAG: ParB/RepB/Spo0J family partition protein [Planctomycetes bacterium]|nr:ParB/RepB/Spo0J family partition protein [Planctomycetota bacterium]
MVERKLGRGLDYFLAGSGEAPSGGESVSQIDLTRLIANPFQPRREFAPGEIEELAASIRTAGVLQPILVRPVGDRYQIVAGERRWRAAKLAGLERIPALIRTISDQQSAVFGLVENLHREDLNPIEKARAFRSIQGLTKSTQDEVARQVGLDRSTVANFVRLLDLPEDVQAHVSRGTLSMGQARAILAVTDAQAQQLVAEKTIRDRLSVRQVEALVQEMKAGVPRISGTASPGPVGKSRPLWVKEIEETLAAVLGTDVSVRYSRKRSRIQINCQGREQFERVYAQIKKSGD